MTSRVIATISIFLALFMTASLALTAVGLKINYDSSQNIHTLLVTGKTSSAISAKKTESIAASTKILVTDLTQLINQDHTQTQASQKELPVLLTRIENAIAKQDVAAINKSVHEVEVYFSHQISKS